MQTDWIILIVCAIVLLFVSLFIYHVLALQIMQHQYKRNLHHRYSVKQNLSYDNIQNKLIKSGIQHLNLLLQSLRLPIRVNQFLGFTLILTVMGFILGRLYFTNLSSIIICMILFMSLPYIVIRGYLIHTRIEAQREFLPAIELFYQCYLTTGGKQIKLALAKTTEEQVLLPAMQVIFTQLHRHLTVYPSVEHSLSIFNHATGHRWSNYFTQLLLVALNEGVSIKRGLKDLIDDMRRARKSNEVERHRLLEIRIANFTPVVFLLFFIGVNLSINFNQTVESYFYDEAGRRMLLHALVLMTLSLLMGIHLSRKKMG